MVRSARLAERGGASRSRSPGLTWRGRRPATRSLLSHKRSLAMNQRGAGTLERARPMVVRAPRLHARSVTTARRALRLTRRAPRPTRRDSPLTPRAPRPNARAALPRQRAPRMTARSPRTAKSAGPLTERSVWLHQRSVPLHQRSVRLHDRQSHVLHVGKSRPANEKRAIPRGNLAAPRKNHRRGARISGAGRPECRDGLYELHGAPREHPERRREPPGTRAEGREAASEVRSIVRLPSENEMKSP